jgi:hypothetical protein
MPGDSEPGRSWRITSTKFMLKIKNNTLFLLLFSFLRIVPGIPPDKQHFLSPYLRLYPRLILVFSEKDQNKPWIKP